MAIAPPAIMLTADHSSIEFDNNTLANMTVALDFVCKNIPSEMDTHETRKRMADAMVESAKAGGRGYADFEGVGRRVLKEMIAPRRSNWFGYRLLTSLTGSWFR